MNARVPRATGRSDECGPRVSSAPEHSRFFVMTPDGVLLHTIFVLYWNLAMGTRCSEMCWLRAATGWTRRAHTVGLGRRFDPQEELMNPDRRPHELAPTGASAGSTSPIPKRRRAPVSASPFSQVPGSGSGSSRHKTQCHPSAAAHLRTRQGAGPVIGDGERISACTAPCFKNGLVPKW